MSRRSQKPSAATAGLHPPGVPPARKWSVRSLALLSCALLIAGVAAAVLLSEVALWRAQVGIENREHRHALHWLNAIRWYRSSSAELQYLLARTHRRLGHETEFQSHLERALQLGWPSSDVEFERDIALLQAGQYQHLQSTPEQLLANAGSDLPEISEGLAKYYLANFRFSEIKWILDHWQERYPNDAGSYFLRGRVLTLLSRLSEASEQYELALKRDPGYPQLYTFYAESLIDLNRFDEALEALRQAPESEQADARWLRMTAECLVALGELEAAQAVLTDLLSQQLQDADAHLQAARLAASMKQPERALEQIREAHQLRYEDVTIREELARLLAANGYEKEAERHFQIVEFSKESWMKLDDSRKQLLQDPDNIELRYEVARATWNWKSHEAGAAWFRSLLDHDPEHRLAHAALADHYELIGKYDLSQFHRDRAGGIESELFIPERGSEHE